MGWVWRLDWPLLCDRFKILFLIALAIFFIGELDKKFGIESRLKKSIELPLALFFFALIVIAILIIAKYQISPKFVMRLFWLEVSSFNFDLLIVGIIFPACYFIWMKVIGKYIADDYFIVTLSTAGLIIGNGTSAGISEISLFIIASYAIAYVGSLNKFFGFYKITAIATSLVIILGYSTVKFNMPYAWWYVDEPGIKYATEISDQKMLSGFRLSQKSREIIDGVVTSVVDHSKTNDDVFVFPNIAGIYALSNRWPHSKVIVSWFDFLPDDLAKIEALRLISEPPAVIVNLSLPEDAWILHEKYFRKNNKMGQRDIYRVIEDLTLNSKMYTSVYSAEVSKGVYIWVWALKKAK